MFSDDVVIPRISHSPSGKFSVTGQSCVHVAVAIFLADPLGCGSRTGGSSDVLLRLAGFPLEYLLVDGRGKQL